MDNSTPTKLVNIFGELPNVTLQILDNKGNLKSYPIIDMVLDSHKTETGYDRNEYKVVYYKGRVDLSDRFINKEKTFWFKYIPLSKKWFVCGDYSELTHVITDRPWYYR